MRTPPITWARSCRCANRWFNRAAADSHGPMIWFNRRSAVLQHERFAVLEVIGVDQVDAGSKELAPDVVAGFAGLIRGRPEADGAAVCVGAFDDVVQLLPFLFGHL